MVPSQSGAQLLLSRFIVPSATLVPLPINFMKFFTLEVFFCVWVTIFH